MATSSSGSLSSRLEWPAIWRAAISVASLAVPLGLTQQWLVDSERIEQSSPTNFGFFLLIMLSGALGGFAAAKLAPADPLPNGAAAGALGYLIVQGAGILRRLAVGEEISSPLGWVYLALLMGTCGMMGAALERRSKPYRDGRDAIVEREPIVDKTADGSGQRSGDSDSQGDS